MNRRRSRDSGRASMSNRREGGRPIECGRQIPDRGWPPHREECNTLHGDPAKRAWPYGGKSARCIAQDGRPQTVRGTGGQARQAPGFLAQCATALRKYVVFNERSSDEV